PHAAPHLHSFPTRRSSDLYGYAIPHFFTAALLAVAGLLVHFGIHEHFVPTNGKNVSRKSFIEEWRHVLTMPGVVLHARHRQHMPDRKSTRLNSSHVKISYA